MRILMLIIILLLSVNLKADVGSFDIIELTKDSKKVYLKIWSTGKFQSNDYCYYNWKNEYIDEVQNIMEGRINNQGESIQVFTELTTLKFNLISKDVHGHADTALYILKSPINIDKSTLLNKYDITNTIDGNTMGFSYSPNISNEDNIWIADYEIEQIFTLTDYETCNFSFYTIKNNLTKSEKNLLKRKLDILLKEHKNEEFFNELERLLEKNIMMIGGCYC